MIQQITLTLNCIILILTPIKHDSNPNSCRHVLKQIFFFFYFWTYTDFSLPTNDFNSELYLIGNKATITYI